MSQKNFWGILIKSLRTSKQWSQRELAEAAKINRVTLSRIEQGLTKGEIDVIEKVLAVFGYELEAILEDGSHNWSLSNQKPLPTEETGAAKVLKMDLSLTSRLLKVL